MKQFRWWGNRMKSKYLTFLLLTLSLLSLAIFCFEVKGYDKTNEESVDVWLILHLREYETDFPISNVSISIKILTKWGSIEEGPHISDEFGKIKVYLGKFSGVNLFKSPLLTGLTLSDNYILIKVNDVFLEDATFSAQYSLNQTIYSNMQISVDQEISGTNVFIKINCWALKGKLIVISDSDPVTGEESVISVKPAVKASFKNETYESFYLAPLNHEITLSYISKDKMKHALPLKIMVSENTSFINWMYYAAKSYGNKEMNSINEEIKWLSSMGLSLDRETKEYEALENLVKRVLDLYDRKDYSVALNGMNRFVNRKVSLEKWLSNLKTLAIAGTICIAFFAYGLSSILSSFLFEEPAKNKERVVTKILLFASLMILFSLTNPSSKIAYVMIIEKAINTNIPVADIPAVLLGAFVISALIYFLITLFSVKKSPVTDLALQLGIRGLKRRPFRTILTLITIVTIVSSSVLLINVSVSRETRIKRSWPSTKISSLIIRSNPSSLIKLSVYDVEWIRWQEWCSNVSYMEEIPDLEFYGSDRISRITMLSTESGHKRIINVLFVDPMFIDKYYDFSKYVRGFWKDFSRGEKVILLPTNYDMTVGDYVTLNVEETLLSRQGFPMPLGTRKLGIFRVIGKFDPSQLLEFRKMDNSLLFKDVAHTVLIPIDSVNDSSVTISEITVIVAPDFNTIDIAKEVAYSLGLPVIANRNGFSFLVEWSLEVSAIGFTSYLIPLVITGLMMYVTMASVYEERKRELFTLATLGLDPRNTFLTFIIESSLFGLLGTFIGFFGSYILILIISFLAPLFGIASSTFHVDWSVFTVFVALFTGIVMTFLGGYIPSVKAQGLSLLGRVKVRKLVGELITEGENVIFILPIRESLRNSELLYSYVRETLRKLSFVDPRSIKGEIYRDGTFNVSFVAIGSGRDVFIPCNLKGERDEDVLALSVVFPRSYMDYEQIRRVLRDLEAHMIGFSAWRDMQLKMKIVREAPKKQKTMDEILEEVKHVMEQMKGFSRKLKILESQKGKLMEEIYNEFREKYLRMLEEKFKVLRSMTIGLEPYLSQIRGEIKKISLEIERITIAYNLGEISEEEYIKICSPMQNKLTMLKSKLKELEEIFEFLKKPIEMI